MPHQAPQYTTRQSLSAPALPRPGHIERGPRALRRPNLRPCSKPTACDLSRPGGSAVESSRTRHLHDSMVVESSRVMVGGTATANFPADRRKRRRSSMAVRSSPHCSLPLPARSSKAILALKTCCGNTKQVPRHCDRAQNKGRYQN